MSYVDERIREIRKTIPAIEPVKPAASPVRRKPRKKPLSQLSFDGVHKVATTLSNGEKRVYFYAWRGGPRLHGETESELKAAFAKIVRARINKAERKKTAPKPTSIASACRALSNNIRARSLKVGLGFYLPWQEIFRMGEAQEWRCAVSGIPFDLGYQREGFAYNPFGLSVDRIKCTNGYEPKNVRLVLTAVNFALNDWGDEIFLQIARAVVEKAENVKSIL